jgi:hypothetical protein
MPSAWPCFDPHVLHCLKQVVTDNSEPHLMQLGTAPKIAPVQDKHSMQACCRTRVNVYMFVLFTQRRVTAAKPACKQRVHI